MFLLFGLSVMAQPEQKDIVDVIKEVFKKKSLQPDSLKLRPGKVFYAFLPGVGYKLVTSVCAVASINASFYLGKITDTYPSCPLTLQAKVMHKVKMKTRKKERGRKNQIRKHQTANAD